MDAPPRNWVLVVGSEPFDESEFTRRDLAIKRVTPADAPAYFNAARAVVVADAPNKFGLAKLCFSELFLLAADHELAQVVLVHSLPELVQVAAIREKDFPGAPVKVFEKSELWKAAQFLARHEVGPPAGDLKIQTALELSPDAILLLRRAFQDCDEIFVESLSGGRAALSVYRVHARLHQSDVGPRPLPFFVKIDTRAAIGSEKQKYHLYAEHYIPFNLRPNLDESRCLQTRSCAALVGDFVDDAIGLRKCLMLGQGDGVLFALFESSLKGFRLQPFAGGKKPELGILSGFVRGTTRAAEIPIEIINRARNNFSVVQSPVDFETALCAHADRVPCLTGPCHGDLHPGNVMVRGGDAILIDFSSAGHGPLTADPAALEVGLVFGKDDEDKVGSFDEWRAFVDQIYEGKVESLHPPGSSEGTPGPFSWLRRSIRELRHILLGCNIDPIEAKIVLAAYLIRYARLGKDALEKGDTVALDRHVYALAVAERLVSGLEMARTTAGT